MHATSLKSHCFVDALLPVTVLIFQGLHIEGLYRQLSKKVEVSTISFPLQFIWLGWGPNKVETDGWKLRV